MNFEYTPEQEDEDDLAFARDLIEAGYKSVSSKNRTIVRLPPGLSGLDALRRASPEAYRRIMQDAQSRAANEYRRVYARREDTRVLDSGEWRAFKAAGGESSF